MYQQYKVFEYTKLPKEIHKIFYEIGCAGEYVNGCHFNYDVGCANYFSGIDEELLEKHMKVLDKFFKENDCVDGESVLISYSW